MWSGPGWHVPLVLWSPSCRPPAEGRLCSASCRRGAATLCGQSSSLNKASSYLAPFQIGVAMPLGTEVGIQVARQWCLRNQASPGKVFLKLDFRMPSTRLTASASYARSGITFLSSLLGLSSAMPLPRRLSLARTLPRPRAAFSKVTPWVLFCSPWLCSLSCASLRAAVRKGDLS